MSNYYTNREGEQVGYTIPDESNLFVVEDYEWGIQYKYGENSEWRMATTNHFRGWYPSEKSAKNALAQVRAPRWGYDNSPYEYRLVRRPVGRIEAV